MVFDLDQSLGYRTFNLFLPVRTFDADIWGVSFGVYPYAGCGAQKLGEIELEKLSVHFWSHTLDQSLTRRVLFPLVSFFLSSFGAVLLGRIFVVGIGFMLLYERNSRSILCPVSSRVSFILGILFEMGNP